MKIETWIDRKDNGPSKAASLIPMAQVTGADYMIDGYFRGRSLPDLTGMQAKARKQIDEFIAFAKAVDLNGGGVLLPESGWSKIAGPDRYKVTVYHGEGSSVFHIIDTQAPEDEQPCVVKSYRDNPSDAAMHCLALNDANDRELAACASQAPFATVAD